MGISDEKYMLLTTFKRDGSAVSTPVWVVPLGEHQVGFWTSSGSGKAKRLGRNGQVTVQASNARGVPRPGSTPITGSARLVTGDQLEEIRRKVTAKYGFVTHLTKLFASIAGALKGNRIPYGDRGVVITLEH